MATKDLYLSVKIKNKANPTALLEKISKMDGVVHIEPVSPDDTGELRTWYIIEVKAKSVKKVLSALRKDSDIESAFIPPPRRLLKSSSPVKTCRPVAVQEETLCEDCVGKAHTLKVKVCKQCRKTSDQDPKTLKFCTSCAKKLGICRSCGEKLAK